MIFYKCVYNMVVSISRYRVCALVKIELYPFKDAASPYPLWSAFCYQIICSSIRFNLLKRTSFVLRYCMLYRNGVQAPDIRHFLEETACHTRVFIIFRVVHFKPLQHKVLKCLLHECIGNFILSWKLNLSQSQNMCPSQLCLP